MSVVKDIQIAFLKMCKLRAFHKFVEDIIIVEERSEYDLACDEKTDMIRTVIEPESAIGRCDNLNFHLSETFQQSSSISIFNDFSCTLKIAAKDKRSNLHREHCYFTISLSQSPLSHTHLILTLIELKTALRISGVHLLLVN